MADLIGPNGGDPQQKPIQIVLTLHPSPNGYALQIDHGQDVFADVIIDACLRAARHYERQTMVQAIQSADAKTAQARSQMQRIQGRIVGGLS